ncbi:MAG: hypothetical protein J6F31_00350 [Oscillospiraceae bacterium]|nr:hypothetical protein [Oscillospiraceae bacterium]
MRSSASEYLEIPKFFVFSVFGIFSGSAGEKDLNYKVVPEKREGGNVLNLYTWKGMNCLDRTEESTHREYPLTQEGYDEMLKSLEDEYKASEDAPDRAEQRHQRALSLASEHLSMDDYIHSGS